MVHWLRVHGSTAGGVGLTPGGGSSTCHTMQPKKPHNKPKIKKGAVEVSAAWKKILEQTVLVNAAPSMLHPQMQNLQQTTIS